MDQSPKTIQSLTFRSMLFIFTHALPTSDPHPRTRSRVFLARHLPERRSILRFLMPQIHCNHLQLTALILRPDRLRIPDWLHPHRPPDVWMHPLFLPWHSNSTEFHFWNAPPVHKQRIQHSQIVSKGFTIFGRLEGRESQTTKIAPSFCASFNQL